MTAPVSRPSLDRWDVIIVTALIALTAGALVASALFERARPAPDVKVEIFPLAPEPAAPPQPTP